mgnify:CR=1 FL=1
MLFRLHRGLLTASMDTVININNIEELKTYIKSDLNILHSDIQDIKFYHIGFDDRTGWDTYYVLVKIDSISDHFIVGMSNNKF